MNKKEKYIIYVAQKCDKIKEELTTWRKWNQWE